MNWWEIDPEARRLESNLRNRVLDEIAGGAWHTTSEQRYRQILASGAILPEPPDLPQYERSGAPADSPYVNYVRGLGGVSLFEFISFDPDAYDIEFRASNWRTFVPLCDQWDAAVWIEVDRDKLGKDFISAANIRAKWRAEESARRFMPMIEAAHIGPLPTTAFRRAFSVRRGSLDLCPIGLK